MLSPPPPKFRRRSGKFEGATASLPPVALTLVAAGYDPTGPAVLLTFDRPVDISAFATAGITLFDTVTNHMKYGAGSASLSGMAGVSIALVSGVTAHGSVVELIVPFPPGIVAVDDGGAWAGTSGMLLPFSE